MNPIFESFCLPKNASQDLLQKLLIAGVDEVGRGSLFGSVVAAAVVLPYKAIPQLIELGVQDSKQLSPKKRTELIEPIKSIVTDWHISEATVAEIDSLNILQASLLAMKRAVLTLKTPPDICLVDGKFFLPNVTIAQQTIIQGDQKSSAIAAASILAKVWRDNLIVSLAEQYPQYDLINNKGYPTLKHRAALQIYGASPEHRKSFAPCRNFQQLEIFD
jgi:ribonuclease HII